MGPAESRPSCAPALTALGPGERPARTWAPSPCFRVVPRQLGQRGVHSRGVARPVAAHRAAPAPEGAPAARRFLVLRIRSALLVTPAPQSDKSVSSVCVTHGPDARAQAALRRRHPQLPGVTMSGTSGRRVRVTGLCAPAGSMARRLRACHTHGGSLPGTRSSCLSVLPRCWLPPEPATRGALGSHPAACVTRSARPPGAGPWGRPRCPRWVHSAREAQQGLLWGPSIHAAVSRASPTPTPKDRVTGLKARGLRDVTCQP